MGQLLWDYLGGYAHIGSAIDGHLRSAIADAINGTNGAVPGGTIYFPPLTGGITTSLPVRSRSAGRVRWCRWALEHDVELHASWVVNDGECVRNYGPQRDDAGVYGRLCRRLGFARLGQRCGDSGDQHVRGAAGNLDITNAFGGVDCIGSSDGMRMDAHSQDPSPGVSPQMAFGFRAQPGSLTGSSLDGLVMKLRRCEPHLPATGAAGFILASSVPRDGHPG